MSEVLDVDLITTAAEVVLTAEPVEIEIAPTVVEVVIETPPTPEIVISNTGAQGPPGPPGPALDEELTAHIVSPTPHPAYDDMHSLTLLFENALL